MTTLSIIAPRYTYEEATLQGTFAQLTIAQMATLKFNYALSIGTCFYTTLHDYALNPYACFVNHIESENTVTITFFSKFDCRKECTIKIPNYNGELLETIFCHALTFGVWTMHYDAWHVCTIDKAIAKTMPVISVKELAKLQRSLKKLSDNDCHIDNDCNAFECYIDKADYAKACTYVEKVFPKEMQSFHGVTIEKARHTVLVSIPLHA